MKKKALLASLSLAAALVLGACGGGDGGGSASPSNPGTGSSGNGTASGIVSNTPAPAVAAQPNQLSIDVRGNVNPAAPVRYINAAFVSVTVCQKGNASNCQTIPNVILDTGSMGLRIFASSFNAPMRAALTANRQTTTAGQFLTQCMQFGSGNTWGAISRADVKLGQLLAPDVGIQLINDGSNAVVGACSSSGNMLNTVSALGANGILGVGNEKQDCGEYCNVIAQNRVYYSCGASTCTGTSVALADQVQNPIAKLAAPYNTGVAVTMPKITQPQIATGVATFGIGSAAADTLAMTGTIAQIKTAGLRFNSLFEGVAQPQTAIDSGSSALSLRTTQIPVCASPNANFLCPTSSPMYPVFSATTLAGAHVDTAFAVNNYVGMQSVMNQYAQAIAVPGIADKVVTGSNLYGLPFYFGRTVYHAMPGAVVNGSTGPFVAY